MRKRTRVFDRDDMVKAARLFYDSQLNKSQIAATMTIRIRDVTRLLKEAHERGIVDIQIIDTPESNLERAIVRRYPVLKKVMIVPGPEAKTADDCIELFRKFGRQASRYFVKMYQQHPPDQPLHVGVTGGARLLEFANAVPTIPRDNVYVHAAALVGHGRLRESASHIEPSVAASILWTHCGSFPGRVLYESVAPFRITKPIGLEARAEVQRELGHLQQVPSIEDLIRGMNKLDVMFAGFGFTHRPDVSEAMENRITMGSLLESVVTTKTLEDEGAVGDLCYCPYRADGSSDKRWQFFLTAGHYPDYPATEFFKHMVETGRKVVGFGGPYLLPAIRAAIKGEFVNVLIIDSSTARELAEGE